MKSIRYSREADAALARMGERQASAIDPASLANNVKALRGTHALRLRVGD